MYSPRTANTMTTAFRLLIPTSKIVEGKTKKEFPSTGPVILANMKTYGGTEREKNGVWYNEDTAELTTWWRPDITGDCRLKRDSDGAVFEIISVPENVEGRNKYLLLKIRRLATGV